MCIHCISGVFVVGVDRVPGVVMFSAIYGVPAATFVITASDVPGVLAVARVSAVADVLTAVVARLLLVFQTFLGP